MTTDPFTFRTRRAIVAVCFLMLMLMTAAVSQPTESDDPARDPSAVWDLTDLYPSPEAWDEARKDLLDQLPNLEARKETFGDNTQFFYNTLTLYSDIYKNAQRVYVYASLRADEDLRVSENQERRQLASQLMTRFSEATSWLQPEMLRIGKDRIATFLEEEAGLAKFSHMIDDILRNAPHTLSNESENILASSGQPLRAGYNVYGLLANSDLPWPDIELSTGEKIRLDTQGYSQHRQSENREDRIKVFDTYWGKWSEYKNTVGATLTSHLQAQIFLSKARKYDSVLDREMFSEKIPLEVYRTLVEQVNKALPTLHRYFKLRERMLGVDRMHYYDIYPPLVSLDKKYTLEEAKRITLEAMDVFGAGWVEMQREALEKRWMHVYPQRGKRSGAYMSGSAYDVHPYLLLNFNGSYDSVSTLAHEWGHAMHTLYAKSAQPFETSDYSIFIAEIPSTTLELVLEETMIANAKTDDERLFYLGSGLESLRGTFFRQTMFAEFELSLYETVERGEALSGDKITDMYREIVRRYHGHDEKVVIVDDLYAHEWMFIPHFYYNMYVYQYATSITAGTALYDKIRREGRPAVDNFINLLKAGGSDYPYNLLTKAGVDLATAAPYEALVRRMNDIMDRMEKILDEK